MSPESYKAFLMFLTVDMSSHLLRKASPLRRSRTQRTSRPECQLELRLWTWRRNVGVDCIDICAVCVPYCGDVVILLDHYDLSSKYTIMFNLIS